jgi:hypothetical protein
LPQELVEGLLGEAIHQLDRAGRIRSGIDIGEAMHRPICRAASQKRLAVHLSNDRG